MVSATVEQWAVVWAGGLANLRAAGLVVEKVEMSVASRVVRKVTASVVEMVP
jgi:hypothetical protein